MQVSSAPVLSPTGRSFYFLAVVNRACRSTSLFVPFLSRQSGAFTLPFPLTFFPIRLFSRPMPTHVAVLLLALPIPVCVQLVNVTRVVIHRLISRVRSRLGRQFQDALVAHVRPRLPPFGGFRNRVLEPDGGVE